MAKETGIKPEFLIELKRLRAKTRFLKYWKENKWVSQANANVERELAINARIFRYFVIHAFDWNLTEEGWTYWYKITSGIYMKAPKTKLD